MSLWSIAISKFEQTCERQNWMKEQQRKTSPWQVLYALGFVLIISIVFACLGFYWADTQMSQNEFAQYPPHAFQGYFFGLIVGACVGFILAIFVILVIVIRRRSID